MPKQSLHPYRLGYRSDFPYPNKGCKLLPSHGAGPRCRVDYDPNDDGPWTMVEIMRIDDDATEKYTCAMPRHYAVPLTLLNKRLAFFEAQCRPDGTPLPIRVPPAAKEGGSSWESATVRQQDVREYAYLWRLRSRFLQAVFDMNHERRLDDRWQFEGLHGYVYRLYRRYGHDKYQRYAYWRGEIKEGRAPYADPDIAKMDWKAYLMDDLTTGMGMNAFLWNRIGQGFSPVVEDAAPQESWRAWSRGHRDRKLRMVPHRTTLDESSSLALRELRGELDAAAPEQQTRPRSRHANPQLSESALATRAGDAAMRTALAWAVSESEPEAAGASASASAADVATATVMEEERSAAGTTDVRVQAGAASSESTAVAASSGSALSSSGTTLGKGPESAEHCASIGDEGEEEEEEEEEKEDYTDDHNDDLDSDSAMDYEDVLTADLSGPPRSQEWALPFPRSRSEQTSPAASQARSGSLRPRQISFKINAPDNLELSVIQCTFSRVEDVGENCKPTLKVAYASKPSNSHSQAPS